MQPVIGISSRLSNDAPWAPHLNGVRQSYIEAILAAGGVPLIIPIIDDEEAVRQLYELADGLLLPGGEDVAPSYYDESPHPQLGSVSLERDRVELQLTRWAAADKKPLLAICRGIQVINVALGGSLFQDLHEQHGDQIRHNRGGHTENWTELIHPLTLEPDCRLAELLGTCALQVNSLHHQAIKRLAPGLRVVGTAPDGVVEAVEAREDYFLLGIQCHPEMLWQEVDPRWQNVFRGFVAAALTAAGHRVR